MNNDYKELVEKGFTLLVEEHESRSHGATGIVDVLQFLIDHPEQIWWWSWEFIGRKNSKGEYLSHRACARASDLALHHTDLVEDRKIGRFKVYRLKVENMSLINQFLQDELA